MSTAPRLPPRMAATVARIMAWIEACPSTGVAPRIVRAAEARERVRRAERAEREGRAQCEMEAVK